MKKSLVHFRPAQAEDAEAIAAMLVPYAREGLVLPRSAAEVRGHIGDFLVAERGRQVLGCVALRDYGRGLHEVRSLVVAPEAAGHGIGTQLVDAAVELARTRGASRVFALTLRAHLFRRLGFVEVDKTMFPQKVWLDCARCRKRDQCDEVAVLLDPIPTATTAP